MQFLYSALSSNELKALYILVLKCKTQTPPTHTHPHPIPSQPPPHVNAILSLLTPQSGLLCHGGGGGGLELRRNCCTGG